MGRKHSLVEILGHSLLAIPQAVAAADALCIQPSGNWRGIDGTWSSFTFAFGTPAQAIDLLPSTYLSEIWLVETSGCNSDQSTAQLCYDARGGVYNVSASSTWKALGGYQLGLNDLSYGGNGDYGLDSMVWTNSLTDSTVEMQGTLVAGINDTDYYEGFLGLGMSQSQFGNNLTNSLIIQMVETYGIIPSYSYGYTAGANYVNDGIVASLTLGGYDELRFDSHDTNFTLNPNIRIPTVLLRGITATVPSLGQAPTRNWTVTEQPLVNMDDSITAIIDSSTPYLWLPPTACDRFAAAFNLTWDEDFGMYLFQDGEQYTQYQNNTALSFVFSLSSFDNGDNFGDPLDTAGVINITVSNMAFAQLFRYPFKSLISYGESAVPYFPLKRSNSSSQYIIGRAFLQEAYLIMRYDDSQFGVYQARFPMNASSNYSLQTIERPSDSPYPAYSGTTTREGLGAGQIAGIVVGAFAIGSIVGLLIWFCCRRRRRNAGKTGDAEGSKKETDSIDQDQPKSPVRRMFSIIARRKKPKPPKDDSQQSSSVPVEVGADAHHAVYELPVPPQPVELDINHDMENDMTEFGTEGPNNMSAYEIARRKMARQLQGPVPSYSAPTSPLSGLEKGMRDVSPVPHYRPPEDNSAASSPTYATSNSDSLPGSLPSPMTPHPDWPSRTMDFPSPMTMRAPPFPSPPLSPPPLPLNSTHISSTGASQPSPPLQSPRQIYAPSSISPSNSSNHSPILLTGPVMSASVSVQRSPIDASRVVYLGPLPDNVRFSRQSPLIPQLITPDGRLVIRESNETSPASPFPHDSLERSRSVSDTNVSIGTLGSDFTIEEERRIRNEVHRHLSLRQSLSAHGSEDSEFPRSPQGMERIEAGAELVHVPQVADRRYSWEEPREDQH